MKTLLIICITIAVSSSLAFAQNNDATTSQDGDQNMVSVSQVGKGLEASVVQIGNNNQADVDQHGLIHEAMIRQAGDHNQASIDHSQTWTRRFDTEIIQTGSHNQSVSIAHNQGTYNAVARAVSRITQTGDWNEASQLLVVGASGPRIDAVIEQSGDRNYAMQEGLNVRNRVYLTIVQEGSDNQAAQLSGHRNVVAETYQTGDFNEAMTFQEGYVLEAIITQNGSMNDASVSQTGDFHSASVIQTGTGNISSISQSY